MSELTLVKRIVSWQLRLEELPIGKNKRLS